MVSNRFRGWKSLIVTLLFALAPAAQAQDEPAGLMLGSFAVTRVITNTLNPREIRRWVETCLNAGDEQRQTVLLFDGDPPNIEAIRQAQIILDLL